MNDITLHKQALAATALLAILSGCDGKKPEMPVSGPVPATAGLPHAIEVSSDQPTLLLKNVPDIHDLAVGERVYRSTCSICHRLGSRGAPRLGDTEDWALRLAQGNETLYRRAINGYRGSKGSMPSRGSNAKLSEGEVKAAVDYMVRYSTSKPHDSLGSHLFSNTAKQFTIHQR